MKIVSAKVILVVLVPLIFAVAAFAQQPGEPAESTSGDQDELNETQERLTDLVRRTANTIDNFFSSERHSWESNKTRVTLRGNLDWLDEHGWEATPEVRIHLTLPGTNDRLRLIINDDDDNESSDASAADDSESNVALRFVGAVTQKYGVSFDLGASTRGDPGVQGFVRANLFRNWQLSEQWVGRLENRLYWYTDSGWRNDIRWYFDHRINDRFFFRARTRLDYQEDKDSDWYPEQRLTLFQQINKRTALAYELIAEEIFFDDSPFDSDEILKPDDRFTQFQTRLRFRQNIRYPWMFYEIWPIALWAEERDYEFTSAIRFRLEIVLGDPPKTTRLGMN